MKSNPPKKWIAVFLTLFAVMVIAPSNLGNANSRYTMTETEEGTLRLDKESGAISFCRKVSGGIACSMAADEREAWVKATEEMAGRIDRLEKRIAYLETVSEVAPQLETHSKENEKITKQSPGSFDTAVNAGKGFLRRVIGALKELNLEFYKG